MKERAFPGSDSERLYLIYNDSADAQPESSIRARLQTEHFAFHVTRRAGELESLLRQTRYTHLILILGHSVSTGLERALSNTRNLANVRDLRIAALLKSHNDFEVQRALMLGVRNLFVLPVDLKWLLDAPHPKGSLRTSTSDPCPAKSTRLGASER